jgi:hypothetical protein
MSPAPSLSPKELGNDDVDLMSENLFLWVAHASRVLVSASRRNNLFTT